MNSMQTRAFGLSVRQHSAGSSIGSLQRASSRVIGGSTAPLRLTESLGAPIFRAGVNGTVCNCAVEAATFGAASQGSQHRRRTNRIFGGLLNDESEDAYLLAFVKQQSEPGICPTPRRGRARDLQDSDLSN